MSRKEIELFVQNVNLKGFKSIDDLSISLNKGINIVIGKNASGKSNFLECLYLALSPISSSKIYKSSRVEFYSSDGNLFVWESEKDLQNIPKEMEFIEARTGYKERLYFNRAKIFDSLSTEKVANFSFNGRRIPLRGGVLNILRRIANDAITPMFLKFNLPAELDIINTPGTIKISNVDLLQFWDENFKSLRFIHELVWRAEIDFDVQNDKNKLSLSKSNVLKFLKIDKEIVENLKKYSPIRDIRFNENINVYKDESLIIIENLKIDFKLNNEWIPWSQLSDGTKRLFYIISEISNRDSGLILLEEPELGIHPHQFNLIMQFLKEQSEKKQIVLTTHSPQALNQLDEKELDRIIISYYEPKKGTKLKQLSKPQIKKAKQYMSEVGFLSDYWMLSDLE